ncbi:unnamed protein product [Spirodela intermedia]|uniref:Uncharacterized protein n=1 Tax=Spirodela intermedia TaxID=51605 RepID=A0A7I8ISY3_SPIIN|nr:unnamed protein product [Spirodela intermedia]CAA6660890.1 unnamed protein product [Spirodela intermedia]
MERREPEGLILELLKDSATEGLINSSQISREILRQQNLDVHQVIQSRIQGLKHEYEILTTAKNDLVVDFAMKFTRIISEATPSKFDALTLSIEQYGDLDKVSLDEVIGSLTVHKLRFKEHQSCEEEQALLARALSKLSYTLRPVQCLLNRMETVCSLMRNL